MSEGAAKLTGATVTRRILGSAWPPHFNKAIAEVPQKNIETAAMPEWSDADQNFKH